MFYPECLLAEIQQGV